MGCDIHWILERRDLDGNWHAVGCKSYVYDKIFSQPSSSNRQSVWQDYWASPEGVLGGRNYDRFAALSSVRGEPPRGRAQIMREGLPPNPSAYAAEECEDGDAHSHGWCSGQLIRELARKRRKHVSEFAKAVIELLESGRADVVLPKKIHDEERESRFVDLSGEESSHAKLERIAQSKQLADWRSDPGSWRLIVYYDN